MGISPGFKPGFEDLLWPVSRCPHFCHDQPPRRSDIGRVSDDSPCMRSAQGSAVAGLSVQVRALAPPSMAGIVDSMVASYPAARRGVALVQGGLSHRDPVAGSDFPQSIGVSILRHGGHAFPSGCVGGPSARRIGAEAIARAGSHHGERCPGRLIGKCLAEGSDSDS
jgi:hypothetical protein